MYKPVIKPLQLAYSNVNVDWYFKTVDITWTLVSSSTMLDKTYSVRFFSKNFRPHEK